MYLIPRAAPIQAKSCRRATAASGRRGRLDEAHSVSVVQEREHLRTPGARHGLTKRSAVCGTPCATPRPCAPRCSVVGRGTWLDGGHPDVTRLPRPIRLSPGRASPRMCRATHPHRARGHTALDDRGGAAARTNGCRCDPFSIADHGGSIGATIATALGWPARRRGLASLATSCWGWKRSRVRAP